VTEVIAISKNGAVDELSTSSAEQQFMERLGK